MRAWWRRRGDEPQAPRRGEAIPAVPLPPAAAAVVERARRLSAAEILLLDAAEADGTAVREVVWHMLRDGVDGAGLKAERMTARNEAWAAVVEAGAAAGIAVPADDRSWRRVGGPGAGAARAARYAACLLVARDSVDPDAAALLIAPWERVTGTAEGA